MEGRGVSLADDLFSPACRQTVRGTTMRVFRDLFIRGEPEKIAAAVDEIDRSLTGGWFRDRDDERLLAAIPNPGGKPTCFGCFAEGDRPGATVILTPRGPG